MAVYFIKHTKADGIKFVGHLDLQKALQRNVSRAGLKAAFSQGFNPHMHLSSAQPLSVGVSSEGEYLLLELQDAPEAAEVQSRLNDTAPAGIRFVMVRKMAPGTAAPMALLDAVETRIRIPSTESFAREVRATLESAAPMNIRVKNKKGIEKDKDLRPLILPGATVDYDGKAAVIRLRTMAGSRNHLNLDHLVQFFRETIAGISPDRFIHLTRLEMYTLVDGVYVPLGEI